jgi:hypothetical protein
MTRKRKEIRRKFQEMILNIKNIRDSLHLSFVKMEGLCYCCEKEAINCLHADLKVNQEPNGLSTRLLNYYMFRVL